MLEAGTRVRITSDFIYAPLYGNLDTPGLKGLEGAILFVDDGETDLPYCVRLDEAVDPYGDGEPDDDWWFRGDQVELVALPKPRLPVGTRVRITDHQGAEPYNVGRTGVIDIAEPADYPGTLVYLIVFDDGEPSPSDWVAVNDVEAVSDDVQADAA